MELMPFGATPIGAAAKKTRRVGLRGCRLQRKRAELVAKAPVCKENAATWSTGDQVAAIFWQQGRPETNSAAFLGARAGPGPSRRLFLARGPDRDQAGGFSWRAGRTGTKPAAFLGARAGPGPSRRLFLAPGRKPERYAVSSATAARSSSTRSRRSQVNSGSSRPKWP